MNQFTTEFFVLKVSNVNQMVDFYTKVIGLQLIRRSENEAYLGIKAKKRIFIGMHKINDEHPNKRSSTVNLKGFTLILPNKNSLKNTLVRIHNLGIKVSKIKINIFYDKVSFKDPEGNVVTLIVNKIDPNANSLDIANLLKVEDQSVSIRKYLAGFDIKNRTLPSNTKLGSLILTVKNVAKTAEFYQKQLGLHCQMDNDTAMLFNKDQCLFVLVQDPDAKNDDTDTLGLDYIDLKVHDVNTLTRLVLHLKNNKVSCKYSSINHFLFVFDPNGISMTISLI